MPHGMGQTIQGRDLAGEGMFEYGSRVGFWRLMRLFQERGLPMTVFGCGARASSAIPRPRRPSARPGYDICSHGWRWIKHYELAEAEEREHIRKAIAVDREDDRRAPEGWYCRYGPGENTRRLVVEEGGFLYDSDYYGDELPFWVTVDGKPQLVVPYSLTNNDGKYAGRHRQRRPVVHAVKRRLRHALPRGRDAAQDDVDRPAHAPDRPSRPRRRPASGCSTTCRSTRASGSPSGVDIARHWIKTHPYPGKGLNE